MGAGQGVDFFFVFAAGVLEVHLDVQTVDSGQRKLESMRIYTEVSIRHLQEVHARTHPGYSKSGRKGSFKA